MGVTWPAAGEHPAGAGPGRGDLLDRVLPAATDLLGRVDDLIARYGGPADHPMWPRLRRVAVLPGDAVAEIASLAPDTIRAAAAPLGALVADCRSAVAGVPVTLEAQGAAARAYAVGWASVSDQIAGDHDGLVSRLDATADYLHAVADWSRDARHALAIELGTCLGSAEAVAVRAATTSTAGDVDPDAIAAAAAIASRVLEQVAGSIDTGWAVRERWSGVAAEAPIRDTPGVDTPLGGHIDVR